MTHSGADARVPRLALLINGIGALIWLSLEDPSLWPPLSLGAAFSGLLTLQFIARRLRGRRADTGPSLLLFTGAGLLAGALACLLAAGLMIFKNARHAHSVPDFPADQLLLTLQLAPQMALFGALAGLALGTCSLLLRDRPG